MFILMIQTIMKIDFNTEKEELQKWGKDLISLWNQITHFLYWEYTSVHMNISDANPIIVVVMRWENVHW